MFVSLIICSARILPPASFSLHHSSLVCILSGAQFTSCFHVDAETVAVEGQRGDGEKVRSETLGDKGCMCANGAVISLLLSFLTRANKARRKDAPSEGIARFRRPKSLVLNYV